MSDLQHLKALANFKDLVLQTHEISHQGKILCPNHNDTNPSCHVYDDHVYCFTCGWSADHIDWLEHVHGLSTQEAIKELERMAGGSIPAGLSTPKPAEPARPRSCPAVPVDQKRLEHHNKQGEKLRTVPRVMQDRGFSLADLNRLNFAALGDDVVFPVTDPQGVVVNLKTRLAMPGSSGKYIGLTGHGTPAWCSPNFMDHQTVLVIEGELNGMACWLARSDIAVMGVSGSSGKLHLEALEGKTVYIYGDGDEAGQKARERWAKDALASNAARVFVVDPWPMDACDIAGSQGREALKDLLT